MLGIPSRPSSPPIFIREMFNYDTLINKLIQVNTCTLILKQTSQISAHKTQLPKLKITDTTKIYFVKDGLLCYVLQNNGPPQLSTP